MSRSTSQIGTAAGARDERREQSSSRTPTREGTHHCASQREQRVGNAFAYHLPSLPRILAVQQRFDRTTMPRRRRRAVLAKVGSLRDEDSPPTVVTRPAAIESDNDDASANDDQDKDGVAQWRPDQRGQEGFPRIARFRLCALRCREKLRKAGTRMATSTATGAARIAASAEQRRADNQSGGRALASAINRQRSAERECRTALGIEIGRGTTARHLPRSASTRRSGVVLFASSSVIGLSLSPAYGPRGELQRM